MIDGCEGLLKEKKGGSRVKGLGIQKGEVTVATEDLSEGPGIQKGK